MEINATATQVMCKHTCLIAAELKQAATEAAAAELSEARQQLQRERADATERVAALADASLRMQVRPSRDHHCDRLHLPPVYTVSLSSGLTLN